MLHSQLIIFYYYYEMCSITVKINLKTFIPIPGENSIFKTSL